MKIGIDIQPLQDRELRTRGIGRYTQALVEGLVNHQGRATYELFGNRSLPDVSSSRLEPRRLLDYPATGRDPQNRLLMRTGLMAADVDAVLLPAPIDGPGNVMFEFAGFPKPVITICYDLIPYLFPEHYLSDPAVRRYYSKWLSNLRDADLVLAISEATRQDAIKLLELDPKRVINISSGVSPFFHPLGDEEKAAWGETLRHKFGIPDKFILYTGGEDWRKNLAGLVKAYGRLSVSDIQGYGLVIACKLSESVVAEVQAQASRLGIAGALTLTGFVTDEELRALYGACSLFVFPSLYEGFGLPVLEAMACGAAVIAGDNSSLPEIVGRPEQLFNAASVDEMAGRITFLLADENKRLSFAHAGLRKASQFSWDSVVTNVEAAMRGVEGKGQSLTRFSVDFQRLDTPRRKSRMAYFSPFSPAETGIANYSDMLVPPLLRYFDIDLYHDSDYQPSADLALRRLASRTLAFSQFEHQLKRREYETILYQVGNSKFHSYTYAALLRYAGITVLHDYSLGGLIFELTSGLRKYGIDARTELAHSHGSARAAEVMRMLETGEYDSLNSDKLTDDGIHINRRIFTRSLGVIVHSRWAYNRAVNEFQSDCEHIAHVPLLAPQVVRDEAAREEIRQRLGMPSDAFLVSTFGFVADTKRPITLLKAFKEILTFHPSAYLLFVGKLGAVTTENNTSFTKVIEDLGLEKRVHVTGFVDEEDFHRYIQATDVCVNLRFPFKGETSSALLHLLAYGKPTIVTDIGSFSEFPDDAVYKIPPPTRCDEVKELHEALVTLIGAVERREALGRSARHYTVTEHSPENCSYLYAKFVAEVMQSPSSKKKLLTDYVGRHAALHNVADPHASLRPFAEAINLSKSGSL